MTTRKILECNENKLSLINSFYDSINEKIIFSKNKENLKPPTYQLKVNSKVIKNEDDILELVEPPLRLSILTNLVDKKSFTEEVLLKSSEKKDGTFSLTSIEWYFEEKLNNPPLKVTDPSHISNNSLEFKYFR